MSARASRAAAELAVCCYRSDATEGRVGSGSIDRAAAEGSILEAAGTDVED